MKRTFRNGILVATAGLFAFSIDLQAQCENLTLVFRHGGKPLAVEKAKIDILSKASKEVLQSLEVTQGRVVIPARLAGLGDFDARISFNEFEFILADVNRAYFDNEWAIDVGDPLNRKQAKKVKNQCSGTVLPFRIDFSPSRGRGYFWLLTGCSNP